jgi:hypothetical protein
VHHLRNKFTATDDTEEAVSVAMGLDKLARIGEGGVRYVVSSEMSCLMHLEGCAHRTRAAVCAEAVLIAGCSGR